MHSYVILTKVTVVANNQSMNELPKVEGLLSYRSDDRKLYLKEKSRWKALATQKDVSCNMRGYCFTQNINFLLYRLLHSVLCKYSVFHEHSL